MAVAVVFAKQISYILHVSIMLVAVPMLVLLLLSSLLSLLLSIVVVVVVVISVCISFARVAIH